MNRYKKSSGSKFQWRPAKPPITTPAVAATSTNTTTPPASSQKSNPVPVKSPEFPQTLNTYLGPRGYTIPKPELTEQQIQQLRKTLTVKPVTGGAAFGAVDAVEYPIYRESSNKIYLPRFYGKSVFGEVKRMAIHPGDDITIDFAGSLRPIQVPVVDAYVSAVSKSPEFGGGGLLELPCAFGKTVLSLNIIARLKKKTLVIVNKEFLLNSDASKVQKSTLKAKILC